MLGARGVALLRRSTGVEAAGRAPVRAYWWGHDTLEDQYEREKSKRNKDVIAWSRPGANVTEKEEYLWAPARIRSEANYSKGSFMSKWTGTTDVLAYTTKKKPAFWKMLFHPEEFEEDSRKRRYGSLVAGQEFVQQRLLMLGPDLAAAHFLCHRNCRVRFRGHKEWTEVKGRGELDIPATFVDGWFIEAIDCSASRLVFEGLQNIRNLHYLKYLDISYCDLIDEWCMDRITGEYADTLEYLNLSGCRRLNWNGLEILWRFKNLKTLVLKDMDHVEDLNLLCLLLLDIFPNLKIIGAEYFDTKLLEGTQYEHLLEDDWIPKLETGPPIQETRSSQPTADEGLPNKSTTTEQMPNAGEAATKHVTSEPEPRRRFVR